MERRLAHLESLDRAKLKLSELEALTRITEQTDRIGEADVRLGWSAGLPDDQLRQVHRDLRIEPSLSGTCRSVTALQPAVTSVHRPLIKLAKRLTFNISLHVPDNSRRQPPET